MATKNNLIKKSRNSGFTIVELLIVIVVIGILALLVITTYSGIQGKARNSKRQTDIASLQTHIEGFYTDNSYYPSLANLNDQTWVKTNMPGTDPQAFTDPSSPNSKTLVGAPAEKAYSYQAFKADGTTACTVATDCAKYTLTATYEGSVNGQSTFTKNSLN